MPEHPGDDRLDRMVKHASRLLAQHAYDVGYDDGWAEGTTVDHADRSPYTDDQGRIMKPYQWLDALREQGYLVRVTHRRPHMGLGGRLLTRWEAENGGLDTRMFAPNGGTTTVSISGPKQSWEVVGESVCSKKDPFSRKTGLAFALDRALLKLIQRRHTVKL